MALIGELLNEKRRHPRFPVGIALDVHSHGQPVNKHRGTIADLSISGMSFETDAVLEQGMSLYLKLAKLDQPLEIRGEIRHMKGSSGQGLHRYGVHFHKIGYMDRQGLRPDRFITAKFRKGKL
ncbi:MAG: PilZ domain-containing protein [Elusimicrobia bacterium]|nr:PilZ domain-containing protein [Elusimicrobiota bacterium]